MKKTNLYSKLELDALNTKKQEFVKELVSSKLSMDQTAFTTATNLQNLLRELKAANRVAAIKRKENAKKVVQ